MKIILSILFASFQLSFAQRAQIAVITNPEIGSQNNAMNLIEVIENIKNQQNVTQVVVIGNITANGKFDEFIWAQEILDELTVPYFIIGGEKDYLLSEGKGSEISMLWDDDKNFFNGENFSGICINSFVPEFPSKNFISREVLEYIDKEFSSSQFSRLLTFSFYPLQSTINSYQFLYKAIDKKIFSFVGKGDKASKNNKVFEGLYLNRKDGWGYLLVSTNKDSVYIKSILSEEIKKKVKPQTVSYLFSNQLPVDSMKQSIFISAGSKVWSVSINKTKITSSVIDAEYIYSVFKNGLVLCLDFTGNEKWRYETNELIRSPPVIENGLLVLASDDGDIITLEANTGNAHQIIGIAEKITGGVSVVDIEERGTITKALMVGTVYGNLYCYDLFTLNPIWTKQLSEINSEFSVASEIVSSNNKIYFYNDTGTLYCLSALNGMLIWKIEASEGGWQLNNATLSSQYKNNLLVKEKDLFLVDLSGNLFCVDDLLGNPKWNIKNIFANGLIRFNSQKELLLLTKRNTIAVISVKLGKVTNEIELNQQNKNESITDLQVIGDKITVSFSDGWVYRIKQKQKPEKYFRCGYAPIISLLNISGECLVSDYDGQFTLLNISSGKK